MKIKFLLICVLVFFINCNQSLPDLEKISLEKNETPTLPIKIDPDSVIYLRNLIDDDFQAVLQNAILKDSKWKRLINQKKMAVGVVDLWNTNDVKYARLNGNVMMYAASLPKIGILLAVMDALEKGEIEDTPEIRAKMRLMISKSNNAAATELMDLVGMDKIEHVLKDPMYDLYDEEYGGGLWVGKRYAKEGARHPDPLMGISHGATVTQVCRYYYLMAYGKLVSYERSKQMLELMDNPALNHKFVGKLKGLAPEAHLYRKSGTWRTYHADSVLVWGPERRYILVALIDDPEGETILRNLVVVVDKLVKGQ